jgi:hypothetical protein
LESLVEELELSVALPLSELAPPGPVSDVNVALLPLRLSVI